MAEAEEGKEGKEGRVDCCESTARGFRDVWWCWILNEPEFPTYGGESGGEHICPGCGHDVEELSDRHTFIAHIRKPSDANPRAAK